MSPPPGRFDAQVAIPFFVIFASQGDHAKGRTSKIRRGSEPPTRRGPLSVFTFREGCSYRQRLLDWLRGEGVQLAQLNEYGSFEAIIGCVAAGMGVSLLPRAVLQVHLAAGTLRTHPTPAAVGRAQTLLVWHRERSRHLARETFSALLKEMLGWEGMEIAADSLSIL